MFVRGRVHDGRGLLEPIRALGVGNGGEKKELVVANVRGQQPPGQVSQFLQVLDIFVVGRVVAAGNEDGGNFPMFSIVIVVQPRHCPQQQGNVLFAFKAIEGDNGTDGGSNGRRSSIVAAVGRCRCFRRFRRLGHHESVERCGQRRGDIVQRDIHVQGGRIQGGVQDGQEWWRLGLWWFLFLLFLSLQRRKRLQDGAPRKLTIDDNQVRKGQRDIFQRIHEAAIP
mmetsp:Transcript_5444/g.13716  ORF Transcript_5444/g.13716 Transcript_5444/m.13716 type:complete len:225 (-) Transcript_5444:115-789(-)